VIVGDGVHVVLELFDRRGGSFSDDDRRLVAAAADFGAEMFRHALGQRQGEQLLMDAVQAALGASEDVASSLRGTTQQRLEEPPPQAVLDQLRHDLGAQTRGADDSEDTLRLAEAIRVLGLRHGAPALQHCLQLVESLREMLDKITEI
jgi:hypothetical protein